MEGCEDVRFKYRAVADCLTVAKIDIRLCMRQLNSNWEDASLCVTQRGKIVIVT